MLSLIKIKIMRIKYYTLITILFLILLTDCYSQDERWLYVTSSDDITVYYDNETVKRSDNTTTVLLKYINAANEDIQYLIYKIDFYRDKNFYKLISVTVYPGNGAPYTYLYNEVKEILPDSIEETAYRIFY
jgi:hypothetical protein